MGVVGMLTRAANSATVLDIPLMMMVMTEADVLQVSEHFLTARSKLVDSYGISVQTTIASHTGLF